MVQIAIANLSIENIWTWMSCHEPIKLPFDRINNIFQLARSLVCWMIVKNAPRKKSCTKCSWKGEFNMITGVEPAAFQISFHFAAIF
ncbi:unnamed protein product, partial [Oikopleura dioica]